VRPVRAVVEGPDADAWNTTRNGTNKITNLNPVDGSVIGVTEGCNKVTAPFLFRN